jgi:hypothetical protein
MPAVSPAQQHLFGMALAIKQGRKPKAPGGAAKRIAEQLSQGTIKDFAATKGFPQ